MVVFARLLLLCVEEGDGKTGARTGSGILNAPMPRKGRCFFACHVFLATFFCLPRFKTLNGQKLSVNFFFFLSFVLYNSATPQKNGGGNFSAPMRDDSETFKNSVAGKSNWNAYEGSGEKALTPEELKAKNAKEDADAAARKAAAIKAQQEYAKKSGAA